MFQESLKKTGAPAEGLSVAVSRDEGKTKRSRFSHIEKLQYAQDQDSVNAQVTSKALTQCGIPHRVKIIRIHGRIVVYACVNYRKQIFIGAGRYYAE